MTKILVGQDTLYDNKICLKIAPLSLLDIYGGMSTRIGIEYKLKKNYALYNEIGTYIPNANGYSNNKGILTKCEFKYYINKKHFSSGGYFSAELFYKYQSFSTWDSITIKPTYAKDFTVYKSVACLTVKFGRMQVFKCGILLDYFFGIGIRYKNATSTLNSNENSNIQSGGDYSLNILAEKSGQYILPNFDAGIKIGYRFK